MTDRERAERRAGRLLRWYPKAWRLRYGEEFRQLLIADIGERPHSWLRTLDVVRRGLGARLARRRSAAGVVLVATLAACLWIMTTYLTAVPDQIACGTHCTPQLIEHVRQSESWQVRTLADPGWAIPLTTAVACAGSLLAFLICRPRRFSRLALPRR